jgi:probable phosphoglycerate mutase
MEHTEGEMGKLYFVRHGQTFWNVENKICGATDIALTPLGHEQAILTGKEILKAGILFDEIISSPLIRASETARHISEVTKKPMRLDARLTEQNFGRYESTARDGKEFQLAKENFADRFGSGEDGPGCFYAGHSECGNRLRRYGIHRVLRIETVDDAL